MINHHSHINKNGKIHLKCTTIETTLGSLLAVADDNKLCLLEFVDKQGLKSELTKLQLYVKGSIVSGDSNPLTSIKKELHDYFRGHLKIFQTPIELTGSQFQNDAWKALIKIPYGETRSYKEQAHSIGNKNAFRAVANANGANPLAIIVPCHRIIRTNGTFGGYSAGIERKKWLIEHETANC